MVPPWAIPVATTGATMILTAVGWLLSPLISEYVKKCCADAPATVEAVAVPGTEEDVRSKINLLEMGTIPELKHTLEKVQEQRMLMAAQGLAADPSRVNALGKLLERLNGALYEAEDILDLIDYHRIENEVGAQIRRSNAAGSSTATREEGATGDDQEDGTALDSSQFTVDGKSLRERIEQIENTLSASKESVVLNQQSGNKELPHNHSVEESQRVIDRLHQHIERQIFGRDGECDKIRAMLRKGPKEGYQVIGIHGVAGSGKTTLAQLVCKHEKAAQKKHFDHVIFIRVSKTFNVIDIHHDMLKDITKDENSDNKDPESASSNEKRKDHVTEKKELKQKLKDKRFLLVLDDLWVNQEVNQQIEEQQEILFDTLNVGKSGSAILVTARTKKAAGALGAVKSIPISQLEEEVYSKMFMHYALKATTSDYEEYEQIGRRIAKKLHRSPIAAVTVAAQLRRNPDIDVWKRTEKLDVLNQTMGALWWSYQQLHEDIRRCFQYCSTFPRGYELTRKTLVDMWIALGFVKTGRSTTKDLKDMGLHYFDELQACSFLQRERTGLVIIHDLLHELAERVAEHDFFRSDVSGFPRDIAPEAHHLFIETYDCDGSEINLTKILEMKTLRTLIIAVKQKSADASRIEKLFEDIFENLRKLRVLKVHVIGAYRKLSVPASIGAMKHLRILGIRFDDRSEGLILPETFAKLYHIQILNVSGARFHLDRIKDIANLTQFRKISGSMAFTDISKLPSLETIPGPFWVGRNKSGYQLQQLEHLNNLRGKLVILGLQAVPNKEEALKANLAAKKRLTRVCLSFMPHDDQRCNPDIEAQVLEGLCPPASIEYCDIREYHGSSYPNWMVGHQGGLENVNTLLLFRCNRLVSIPEGSQFFAGLRTLELMFCTWDALPDHMERLTSLRKLVLSECFTIKELPTLPPSLECITLKRCDDGLARNCVETLGENWKMIKDQDWIDFVKVHQDGRE